MVRLRPILPILMVLVLVTFPARAEVVQHSGQYVPGAAGVVTIWCSADQHALVPVGGPEEYATPEGWLFSGEPECAPADAWNALNEAQGKERVELGIGGFAWRYEAQHELAPATAWTEDAAAGMNTYMHLISGFAEDDFATEGCGPQTILLSSDGLGLLWAVLPEVGVTDELEFCFSSAGVITARYGL